MMLFQQRFYLKYFKKTKNFFLFSLKTSLYASFRNPSYFKDATLFKPERFADSIDNYNYMPFSVGPRNCIGQIFAIVNIKRFL